MFGDDLLFQRLWCATLVSLIIVMAVFAAAPWLDLWVSALFYDPERGFWRAQSTVHVMTGVVLRRGFELTTLMALLILLAALLLRLRLKTGWRVWAFVVGTVGLGPLLIVNGIFKAYSGRARPADVAAFGGDKAFTPPFQIAQECGGNCAFTSGEGALAAAICFCGLALIWHRLGQYGRQIASAAAAALLGLAAGLRIALGRHFLSDTLISVLLSALIALALYRLLRISAARPLLTGAALRADLAAIGGRLADDGAAAAAGVRRLFQGRS